MIRLPKTAKGLMEFFKRLELLEYRTVKDFDKLPFKLQSEIKGLSTSISNIVNEFGDILKEKQHEKID